MTGADPHHWIPLDISAYRSIPSGCSSRCCGVCVQGMALLCMSRPLSDTVRIETQSDWGYSLGVGEWKGATGHIAGKEVDPLTPWGTDP